MKTKIKKRFLTANQIRDEIDKYKEKAERLRQSAEAYELKAKELRKAGPSLEEDAKCAEEQAKKNWASIKRIKESRLPKLKEKLAEWSTELLPGVIADGDRSIQA